MIAGRQMAPGSKEDRAALIDGWLRRPSPHHAPRNGSEWMEIVLFTYLKLSYAQPDANGQNEQYERACVSR